MNFNNTRDIFKEFTKSLMDPTYAIEAYLETFDKTQEVCVL
jgi:hypothetical protein